MLARTILALETAGFAEALQSWLEQVSQFNNITILAFFDTQQPSVFLSHAHERRVFERLDSDYVNGAYLLDPFYGLHKNRKPDGLYRLADVAPDQFQRNEYFRSYYQRTTLIDELAFFSSPAPGVSITVCIGRDATTTARFSTRDLTTARDISPVVNALVRKNWRGIAPDADSIPHSAAESLRARLSAEKKISLSKRQAEIAFMILQGHSSISIGLVLGISPQTVKVIRKQLYKKCQISSQGELYYLIAPYLSNTRQDP
ncbi:helix-turn-helix transcriptional regulator [Tropicibacter sp. Alg240-R139]|uniref:helix-turn-helix transcriptional regulator n=1 Tax=Tropicibacter sp. Alg240-R139 TaxID=2305991 RepID=UPI001F080BD8|nr:helix-turn-helix transcriptional regulator [Tropicibacter sp. Alg240-R139]